jgi:hypothetical protein
MPLEEKTTDETQLAVMATDISYIKIAVDAVKKDLEEKYVTKDMFDPVKKIAYGLVGGILFAILAAVLGLVIKK